MNKLPPLTTTNLRRLNSSIYAMYELIRLMKIDNYEFITDTLIKTYFELQEIIEDLEDTSRRHYYQQRHNQQ